jgi:hypothetical protein
VRLIDRHSGARLMLQLPAPIPDGPILDISATPTSLAMVGSDGSIAIFKVPEAWDTDDPPCPLISHIVSSSGESDEGLGRINKVEWIRKEGAGAPSDWLIIGGELGLVVIKPSKFKLEVSTKEIIEDSKILVTDGVSRLFCIAESTDQSFVGSRWHVRQQQSDGHGSPVVHRVLHALLCCLAQPRLASRASI